MIKPIAPYKLAQLNRTETAVSKTNPIASAFKELFRQFKDRIEIGKFDDIVVQIDDPLKTASVKKSYIAVTADAKDLRTRALSFIAESPRDNGVVTDMTLKTGTKHLITEALQHKSTIEEFKAFIQKADREFR